MNARANAPAPDVGSDTEPLPPAEPRLLPGWLRVVHVLIILNFLVQMVYAGYQVFVVFQPEGHIGPAFGAIKAMPFEHQVVRRLYAFEGWFAFIGLAVYLGLTEILPRRLRR